MSKPTIKEPCPFCGSKNLYHTSNGIENEFVECDDCGTSGPVLVDAAATIAAWDRRALPEQAELPPLPRACDMLIPQRTPVYDAGQMRAYAIAAIAARPSLSKGNLVGRGLRLAEAIAAEEIAANTTAPKLAGNGEGE